MYDPNAMKEASDAIKQIQKRNLPSERIGKLEDIIIRNGNFQSSSAPGTIEIKNKINQILAYLDQQHLENEELRERLKANWKDMN